MPTAGFHHHLVEEEDRIGTAITKDTNELGNPISNNQFENTFQIRILSLLKLNEREHSTQSPILRR